MSIAIEQRQNHLGVSADQARDQSAPLVSWRWLQSKQIQPHHHEASLKFSDLWFSYLRAIDDQNSRLKRSRNGYVDPEDPDYIERCKRIRAEFEAMREALIRSDGWRAAITVSVENKEIFSLQPDFREAMNLVHRLLIAAEGRSV